MLKQELTIVCGHHKGVGSRVSPDAASVFKRSIRLALLKLPVQTEEMHHWREERVGQGEKKEEKIYICIKIRHCLCQTDAPVPRETVPITVTIRGILWQLI